MWCFFFTVRERDTKLDYRKLGFHSGTSLALTLFNTWSSYRSLYAPHFFHFYFVLHLEKITVKDTRTNNTTKERLDHV